MTNKLPTYFISHGGGPWPYMDGPFRENFRVLEASLKAIAAEQPAKPRAIVMISGHWEENGFDVMASPNPPMIYDYGGFPAHTYEIVYPAPGDPALAARVQSLITAAGLPSQLDPERGFDHGAFSTLFPMYPEADVPVVQVAMQHGYSPAAHLALGRALAPLREEGVLIIGSGLSYHNLRAFGAAGGQASAQFGQWLDQTMEMSGEQRNERLQHWAQAPAARIAHPREDHLVPLFVAAGAAENERAERIYYETDFMGALTVSSYRFGELG
jgi:aromatic ring-opening dioxygenase catalytic subunit (LigB family)